MVQGPHPAPPRTPAPAPATAALPPAVDARRQVAPEQVTGAQSIVRSLEEAGVEVVFGIPGGAILPTYDPLMDSTRVRHILVRHEQGGGHAAAGYAAATGRVGVCMATSRPGRDQPRHRHRRRPHGLGAAGRDHRSGRRVDDRHGRVPGGRHRRHHAADHQAQLPRHRPGRHPARRSPRRSTSPRPAVPAPCSSTSPSPRCRRAPPSRGRRTSTLPGYHPVTKPHAKQIREAARLLATSRRPVLLRRRRRHPRPRVRPAARA